MSKKSIEAHVVAHSDTLKPKPPQRLQPAPAPRPPNVSAIIKVARAELDTLEHWVSVDPDSPHIQESGHRLLSLAETLIKIGGKR